MRIALAQIDPAIGDFRNNLERLLGFYGRAASQGADLVVAPELAIAGYPPKDLLEKQSFVDQGLETLRALAEATRRGPGLLVGYVERNPSREGKPLFNAAALLDHGAVVSVHRKSLLPTYDVFDEARYFEPCREVRAATFRGRRIGVTICEDIWLEDDYFPGRRYGRDPVGELLRQGPELIVNLSASPWHRGKHAVREALLAGHARRAGVPLIFVNQVGGEDELVFDGTSMVVSPRGAVVARAREFEEDLLFFDEEDGSGDLRQPLANETERTLQALVLGLKDYFRKTGGLRRAVIGLSGGIDSSLVACIAAEALGPANVLGVRMPSRFSSPGSLDDAAELARNLSIELWTIPIEPLFQAFLGSLDPVFRGLPFDVAEENIQARIRGTLLMAISNKFGHIVLSTGNKSELAVGYCTLYGDMSGGFAPISDVPKTAVYEIARLFNATRGPIIPAACFTKPPSAELRPNQTDQDSLPPYELLDRILEGTIERGKEAQDLIADGIEKATVQRVIEMVDRNEYKRRQAAPGIRVTRKAFGTGRRVPIAHRFRHGAP